MVGTTFDAISNSLAAACIYDAENEIKKQLSNQFDLTLSYFTAYVNVPPMVETLTLNLAQGYMYEANSRGSKEGYARADRYIKRAMDNLAKIADGSLQLLDNAGAQIVPTKTKWQVKCNTSTFQPTFDEDEPRRWKIDPNKLDAIESARGETNVDQSDEID